VLTIFFAKREEGDLIGWQQTLAASPPNHIYFLLFARKNRQVENRLMLHVQAFLSGSGHNQCMSPCQSP
jgi:hypothetical protein